MLRRRDVIGWFTSVLILACPLVLSGADTELQGPKTPIAHLKVQATRIDWLPQVDYERLVLTVAGPDDIYIHQVFEAGQAPQLSLFSSKGDRLPDGIYAYELRVVPRLSPEFREKLAKARDAGDDSALAELRKAEKLQERPLVQSGYLDVREGSFVDPSSLQQAPEKKSAPGNITPKTVDTGACFGNNCAPGDNGFPLRLKDSFLQIRFEDVPDGFSATRDWAIHTNDIAGGVEGFFIEDFDAGTFPFSIEGNAPDHSLYLRSNGNLGLGTSTPAVRLDVKANSSGAATERLQNSSATGYSGTEYLDNTGNVDLFFGIDNAAATTRLNSVNNNPIVVLTNSVEKMRVTSAGDVGIGTASPATQLHIRGTDAAGAHNKILVENAGTANFRELFEVRNNGGTFIIFKDTGVTQRWSQGTLGTNLILDEQVHAGTEYTFTNTGNLTIAGVLTQGSSRELKTDLSSLDPTDVLARVSTLPVSSWSYKTETAVRHVGPMAEDFHHAFGLGADDKHIAPGDQAGVALLAVQGLNQILQNKAKEIATLQHENNDLAKRVATLETLLSTLIEKKSASAQAEPAP